MAKDSANLQYGGDGAVYLGPVGTAAPTDVATALNAAFIEFGYTTEDGVTITPSTNTNSIPAWQSFYPIDRRVTSRDLTVSFSLLEVKADTFELNFDGTWATAGGVHTFTPSSPETLTYKALVVEWEDGAEITRLHIPKVMVSDPGAMQIRRSDPSTLDMTLGLVTTGSGNPYTVISNAANFA